MFCQETRISASDFVDKFFATEEADVVLTLAKWQLNIAMEYQHCLQVKIIYKWNVTIFHTFCQMGMSMGVPGVPLNHPDVHGIFPYKL